VHDFVTLLIFTIPVAGLTWFAWTCTGPYQRRKKSATLEKLRRSNRYCGITIHNRNCPAARRVTGRYYSFEEVPELPLAGCKALRCTCVYAGLNTRRYQERRSRHDPRSAVRFDPDHPDRRQRKDRRKSNRIKWQDPAG